ARGRPGQRHLQQHRDSVAKRVNGGDRRRRLEPRRGRPLNGATNMTQVAAAVVRLVRRDEAQDLLEYGLLCALIALVAFGAVTALGQTITNVFWNNIAQNF